MKDVLIIDDHPVVRMALKLLLETDNMTVVAETDDGYEALNLTKKLSPDLIIVDIDMPSYNGIDLVQRLRNNGFAGGILVLTGKDVDHYIKRSANAGADGFISKRNNMTELHDAIRAINAGYGFFPLNRKRHGMPEDEQEDKVKIATLSSKELQVLVFLTKGMKVVEMAQKMKISDKTVSTYKRRLMEKLDIDNMVGLYEFAKRNNIS
ncbi:response regulator [Pantoea rwandensis]|uniref:DNA-binding response regulator n=1 Tax=Pantoea rwandensis TaxID=1076550 RepID=A0A1X1CVM1_9GAMM|nr:response regulator [Pantoea rwandensis]ORM68435.1 DNA-binding response regulator [Pantoea rwandensis]